MSLEWAENEIRLAMEREKAKADKTDDGLLAYACGCYESALKAYKSLAADGHSGMSWGFTKSILTRLMDDKPLTPIEDTDDAWSEITDKREDFVEYQCKRYPALFKTVWDDGKVEYDDNNRIVFEDKYTLSTFSFGFGKQILEQHIPPITMPYFPGQPYIGVTVDFLLHPENGDFDHFGIEKLICPDGMVKNLNEFWYLPDGKDKKKLHPREFWKRYERRIKGG